MRIRAVPAARAALLALCSAAISCSEQQPYPDAPAGASLRLAFEVGASMPSRTAHPGKRDWLENPATSTSQTGTAMLSYRIFAKIPTSRQGPREASFAFFQLILSAARRPNKWILVPAVNDFSPAGLPARPISGIDRPPHLLTNGRFP